MTEPLEPITFPYLTTEKQVCSSPEYELPATKSLSEVSFVAPYKFAGLLALSVDNATILFTAFLILVIQQLTAPWVQPKIPLIPRRHREPLFISFQFF